MPRALSIILGDFSINEVTHTLHYLLKMLQNMQQVDSDTASEPTTEEID